MTGCYTCGGGMGKHDPVAHDWTDESDDLADAIVRTMHVVPPSADEVVIATGVDYDEPCMCGTDFTCMAEVHWVCDNCGADLRTCDCDES